VTGFANEGNTEPGATGTIGKSGGYLARDAQSISLREK